ncbi:protein-tyrosine phosphatase-like protein [Amanita rubescens]|nr:protein-tyrosine phosphatase-like protein [Amanita rubescens]
MSRLEIYTTASSPSHLPVQSGKLATSCAARTMRPQRPHPRLQSFAALAIPAVSSQTSDLSGFYPPSHSNNHAKWPFSRTLLNSLHSRLPIPSRQHITRAREAYLRSYRASIFLIFPSPRTPPASPHIVSPISSPPFPTPSMYPLQPFCIHTYLPSGSKSAWKTFHLPSSLAHLPQTTAWIGDALSRDPNSRVLVHCVEGISRSVSVVAAYLMAHFGWTPTEALKFIKNKRRVAEPNFGFVQQLHEYARDKAGQDRVDASGCTTCTERLLCLCRLLAKCG